ncbi:MAG: hypothetical protein K6F09_00620 [Clostridiales bacterium]|nr:hypothetical protein [Clostridiales bacterium]
MKAEFLALIQSDTASIRRAGQQIEAALNEVSEGGANISLLKTSKEFLGEMSKAFSRSELIVAAVEPSAFLDQKWVLLKALGISGEINQSVISTIEGSAIQVDDSSKKAHALMPKDANVFLSNDGLYDGFAIKKGRQVLVYLPLSDERLPVILNDGFKPFMASEPIAPKKRKKKNMFMLAAAAIKEKDLSVTVADTQTSIFAKHQAAVNPAFGELLTFRQLADGGRRRDEDFKTYVARISDEARIEGNSDLGAVISNVYTNGKDGNQGMFVFIAVSDRKYAHIKKILSKEGESPNQLVEAATKALFSMLREYCETNGNPPDTAEVLISDIGDREEDGEDDDRPKSTGLKIMLGIVILIIIGLFIAFLFEDVRAFFFDSVPESTSVAVIESDKVAAALNEIVDEETTAADEKEETTETETVAETTVPETTKTVKTSKLKTQIVLNKVDETTAAPETTTEKPTETTTKKIETTTAAPETTTAPATTVQLPVEKPLEDNSEKPETTKAAEPTTTAAVIKAESKSPAPAGDSIKKEGFTFTSYGYGHGVGMSQVGAIMLGDSNGVYKWRYTQILAHYYPGTALTKDLNVPSTVTYGGKSIPTRDYLARALNAEIGTDCKPNNAEGVKAQIVAIYTLIEASLKNSGVASIKEGQIAYTTKETPSAFMYSMVDAVYGEYLIYTATNKPANTLFSSSCAGKSASSAGTWGGNDANLAGGVLSPEKVVYTYHISSEDFKKAVANYNARVSAENRIVLSGDPSTWIKIISHDDAYNDDIGYISQLQVGNQVMRGNDFRIKVMDSSKVRSHCFTVVYTPASAATAD